MLVSPDLAKLCRREAGDEERRGTQTASVRRLIRLLYISRPATVQSAVLLYLAFKEESLC